MRIFCSLVLTALISACSSEAALDRRLGALDLQLSFAPAIEALAPDIMERNSIPGAAILLIEDGEVVLRATYGRADHEGEHAVSRETRFLLASISKMLAAWTALEAAERGIVDLDAPVSAYLPENPLAPSRGDIASDAYDRITLRQLLSHTAGLSLSGYAGVEDPRDLPDLAASLSQDHDGRGIVRIESEPGSAYSYSSGGYTLMQLVLETATGESLEQLAETMVFEPLGMASATFEASPMAAKGPKVPEGHGEWGRPRSQRYYPHNASGAARASLLDMERFAKANVAAPFGSFGGGVLEPQTLRAAMTPVPETIRENGWGYGLGYQVQKLDNGVHVVGHDGSSQAGFKNRAFFAPEEGNALVILTNSLRGDAFDYLVCLWRARLGGSDDLAAENCPG